MVVTRFQAHGTGNIIRHNVPLSHFEDYFRAVNNPDDPFYKPDEDVLYFNERFEENEFQVMFDELNITFDTSGN